MSSLARKSFPIKFSITKLGNVLITQGTGEVAFSLEVHKKDQFKFDQAGIILEFDTAQNQMTFKKDGSAFILNKE